MKGTRRARGDGDQGRALAREVAQLTNAKGLDEEWFSRGSCWKSPIPPVCECLSVRNGIARLTPALKGVAEEL